MARHVEFDQPEALERATLLFWEKGYSNTSLRDLLAAMGIGQSSFYNFVTSKKELYLRCLKHYNDTVTRRRWQALTGASTFGDGVRSFFTCVLDDLENPKTPNVCLMAGSLAADVLSEKDLSRYVLTEMTQLEAAIVKRLEEAKGCGEVAGTVDSQATAAVIVTFLQGLFRVARVLKSRKQLEAQVRLLLTGLGV
jgi:TetR/AcrR family transcriptional repressor of nem operon